MFEKLLDKQSIMSDYAFQKLAGIRVNLPNQIHPTNKEQVSIAIFK